MGTVVIFKPTSTFSLCFPAWVCITCPSGECCVVNISCTTCEKFQLVFRKGFCAMSASFWEEQARRQVPVQIHSWCFQLAGSQQLLTGHTRQHLIALPRHPVSLDPTCTVQVLSHSEFQCSWLLLTLLDTSTLKIGAPGHAAGWDGYRFSLVTRR